jgi:Cu/Zn superoxide dismutase
LVNLVKEWEVLEDYAGDKQGFYQILGDAEAVEIRVAMGRRTLILQGVHIHRKRK